VIDFFTRYWEIVVLHPLVFISAIAAGCAAGYGVSKWYYKGIIENKNSQIEILKSKSEGLGEFDLTDEAPLG
jgi:hypothetical protein